MKLITTLFLTLLPSSYLFSQVPLTTLNNTLRHGDILCKIEVPYVEQGDLQETKKNPSLNYYVFVPDGRGNYTIYQYGFRDGKPFVQIVNNF